MKRFFTVTAALALACFAVFAQPKHEGDKPKPKTHFKVYGFIRNFYAFDTRENVALTEDFFTYLPKDQNLNSAGEDLNANPNFKFAALTSRLGIDVLGYEYKDWKFNAKIEADFYNGLAATSKDPLTKSSLTGTAVLRLRQAFVSMTNGTWTLKAGQGWHPMAADMPDVFSLNTGAPFGPFSRTPLVSADYSFGGGLSFTMATMWQMQYTSTGPYGASANYIRNGGGEVYAGINYKKDGFLGRVGIDALAISPRTVNDAGLKVDEKSITYTPFLYLQYVKGPFSVKAKTVFAEGGEHVNLNGGYGISGVKSDGISYTYTPTRNSSSWVSLQYKTGPWQLILFGGYVKNFGTKAALSGTDRNADGFYFSKNSFSNMNGMWRTTPTVIYNFGKLQLGLEYEVTSVQYGDSSKGINLATGLYDQGLHWITNNRVQTLVKFNF